MKKLFILLAIIFVSTYACKKDKPAPVTYETITRDFIFKQGANLKDIDISIGKNGFSDLNPGAIILFKSHLGNYGKMEIVSVNAADITYPVVFNLTVYKPDGQVQASVENQAISSSYGLDLETGTAASGFGFLQHNSNNGVDFYFFSIGEVRLYLFKN
jgi:hypothetical protein